MTTSRVARCVVALCHATLCATVGALVCAPRLEAQCANGAPLPCATGPASRRPPPNPASVAVLPLLNRSPDSADVYLADGLTEEVGNRLTQLGRLEIKSRGLVDAQWRRTPDPLAAAKLLNVAYYVEGNVRRAGAQLLVNVQLVRVSTGAEVMASRFVRSAADVFAVQAEVAESIAVMVGGRLSPVERATLAKRPTRDNEAYRLYVLGNSLVKRRGEQDMYAAIAAYSDAVRRDPEFAAAWARLSVARGLQTGFSFRDGLSDDSLKALARIASRRALTLDPLSAEAHLAAMSVAGYARDFGAHHGSCQRALQLDSLQADVWHWCGSNYAATGGLVDVAMAEPLFRRALALDPDMRVSWRNLAWLRRAEGRLRESEALFDSALAVGPFDLGLRERAYIRFLRGNVAGAEADLAEAERISGVRYSLMRAHFVMAVGDSAPAREQLTRARSQSDPDGGVAFWSAAFRLRTEVLDALERLRATPDPGGEATCAPATPCSVSLRTWRALHDPIYLYLRGEPRFIRLMEETRPRIPWLKR